MQHIYGKCKHTEAVRVKAVQKAGKMWGKAQRHGEARLLEIDYFTQHGATMVGGEWQRWWGWMGLVPKEVRGKVSLGEVKLPGAGHSKDPGGGREGNMGREE